MGRTLSIAISSLVLVASVSPAWARAGWEPPFRIDRFAATAGPVSPQAVLGATGTATVAWQAPVQAVDPITGAPLAPTAVRVASGPGRGPLSAPATLSGDPAVATGDPPILGGDEAGSPTLLFLLRSTTVTAGILSWPAPGDSAPGQLAPLSHPALTNTGSPQLAVGPRGHALAVWDIDDGAVRRLQAAYRPPGGAFEAPRTITPAREAGFPQLLGVAIADSGRAAVAYHLGGRRYVQRVAPNGHFGTRLEVKGDFPAQLEFDAAENLVGLFTSRRGAVKQAVARPRRRRFANPEALARAGVGLTLGRGSEAGSRLVAAWARDAGVYQVSVASPEGRLGPAAVLLDPVPVHHPCTRNGPTPSVSSNARGDAVIAWCSVSGIMAAVQPAGGRFGPPELVSTDDGLLGASNPSVAMDPQGNAIAAWGTADGVKGARYSAPER